MRGGSKEIRHKYIVSSSEELPTQLRPTEFGLVLWMVLVKLSQEATICNAAAVSEILQSWRSKKSAPEPFSKSHRCWDIKSLIYCILLRTNVIKQSESHRDTQRLRKWFSTVLNHSSIQHLVFKKGNVHIHIQSASFSSQHSKKTTTQFYSF